MNISKVQEGTSLRITLEGRLDTTTAPQLENVFKESLSNITSLVLDFSALSYISSAGLRVILSAIKIMKKQGSMVVQNVNQTVMEVFDITGFSDMLDIR
ncbi:MAG: STAS domain-containing protein [Christensenellales bacterium]|nr:STAS domain-containing protein [Christensenellales bacterium]